MAVTYSTIIEYLLKNNKDLHNDLFITNKNDYGNIHNIFNIFNNNYHCYGIYSYNNNENISMYSSILTLLEPAFILPYYKDELTAINNFKNNIINNCILNNIEFINLKYNDKLQVIVNIFNINIIIFDKIDITIDTERYR